MKNINIVIDEQMTKFVLGKTFIKNGVLYAYVKKSSVDLDYLKETVSRADAESLNLDFDELMEIERDFLISFERFEELEELKSDHIAIDLSKSMIKSKYQEGVEQTITIIPKTFYWGIKRKLN